jgi:hypothetical protein
MHGTGPRLDQNGQKNEAEYDSETHGTVETTRPESK